MSNYTPVTNWVGLDSLLDTDPNKVISGSTFDTEFNTIKDAINSKQDTLTIKDEDDMTSDSATAVASQQSIKAYVDANKPQVIQTIVQPHTTSQTVTTSGVDITGFSATITPKSTASRIRIDIRWVGEVTTGWDLMLNITRDGTSINLPSAAGGNRNQGIYIPLKAHYDEFASTLEAATFFTIDSPASASAITYQLRATSATASKTMWTGRTAGDSDSTTYERATGEIILTEIL